MISAIRVDFPLSPTPDRWSDSRCSPTASDPFTPIWDVIVRAWWAMEALSPAVIRFRRNRAEPSVAGQSLSPGARGSAQVMARFSATDAQGGTPDLPPGGFVRQSPPCRERRPGSGTLEVIAGTRSWAWPLLSAAIGLVFATALATIRRQIDLGTYLLGGAHAFQPDLYRVAYQHTGLGFTYPPFAAFWFVPLAHLPVRLDQILFTWVSLGALFVVLATSLRVTGPNLQGRTVAWWSLLLLTPIGLLDPPRETILLGQVNILLAAAVIADMTLIRPGRRGVLVGLAAAIKITPIILIPYLILTRQTGAWRRAAGAFVAATGIAFIASPHASWTYWSHDLWDPGRAGNLAWVGNQGAVGAVERLLHHSLNGATAFGLVAVISGIGLLIAVKAYRRSWPVLGFLVVEATESMASPVSWSHHFIWIVLLIAWLVFAPDRPAHGEWWATVVAVVFWAAPLWWVPHGSDVEYAGHGWSILLSDSFFVVLAAILLATSARLVRRRARRPQTVDTLAQSLRWSVSRRHLSDAGSNSGCACQPYGELVKNGQLSTERTSEWERRSVQP
jgi:alpha-1,2-mannosyltransferase